MKRRKRHVTLSASFF
uniref:Uncharacterized protein n=1 Tax=Anguilla anguilla TaxID=7936 RepID=A0A0E9VPT4_ANGAN